MFKELVKIQRYKEPKVDSRYHKQYVKGFIDYYVGITVPELRKLSKKNYQDVTYSELDSLITSRIHEYRLLALIILHDKYKKTDKKGKKRIVEYYKENLFYVNNWDLVDVSAYNILGDYLYSIQDYTLLYEYANSSNLWFRRVAVVATNHMIKNKELNLTFNIVDILLEDPNDIIQKANGWMLRNCGDKDRDSLTKYLKKNYHKMPRTTLRYAIEHYPEETRKKILKGEF